MRLPNGSQFAIAKTFGTGFTVTSITNANPGVATLSASHGVIVNDIIEVSSGWMGLDKKVARASVVATNDVTLEGINTSNTTRYPSGGSAGTGREVTVWTSVTNILDVQRSGGDQSFFDYLFLDDPSFTQKQIPSFRSPMALNFRLEDDTSKAWYADILAASDAKTLYPLRITLPGGALIYLNGIWSLNEMPTFEANTGMALDCSFAMQALPTRYAS